MSPTSSGYKNRPSKRPPAWTGSKHSWLTARPWRWRRLVPATLQLTFNGLHGVMSEKVELFRTIAVRISDPSHDYLNYIFRATYIKYLYDIKTGIHQWSESVNSVWRVIEGGAMWKWVYSDPVCRPFDPVLWHGLEWFVRADVGAESQMQWMVQDVIFKSKRIYFS
jgi:hypothetical protein